MLTIKNTINNAAVDWTAFCIEMYADENKMSGQEVIKIFDRFGVLEYLTDNYEALHTQGTGYVLPLIEEYMREQEPVK